MVWSCPHSSCREIERVEIGAARTEAVLTVYRTFTMLIPSIIYRIFSKYTPGQAATFVLYTPFRDFENIGI